MFSPSLIAARSIVSSSFVHDRRSRTRMLSDPKSFEVRRRKVIESIQENKRHTDTTFCKKKNVVDTTLWKDCVKIKTGETL